MKLPSYPKVWNVGHRAIARLWDGPVLIEEKLDGSQFSFGVVDGVLHCRSKGAIIHVEAPPALFRPAVETAKSIQDRLVPGWVYRAEAFARAKHNCLKYDRAPRGGLALYDITVGGVSEYITREEKEYVAATLGLEVVPMIASGAVVTAGMELDFIKSLLDRESLLGGEKIEGVVIKNYTHFTADEGWPLFGKYVREDFKERNSKNWRADNPTKGDLEQQLIDTYRCEPRWRKAIQHLRDSGVLEGSPRDIGKLIPELQADLERECKDEILAALWDHFWPKLRRGISQGFPEYYKDALVRGDVP